MSVSYPSYHQLVQSQQPQIAIATPEPWNESLCGCCSDCSSCMLTSLYPCVQFGLNQEALDDGSCCSQATQYYLLSSIGCCCLLHTSRRAQLRAKYNLAEEGCGDCLTTTLCPALAICQEAREIKSRSLPRSHPAVMANRKLLLNQPPQIQSMPMTANIGILQSPPPVHYLSAPSPYQAQQPQYPLQYHPTPSEQQQLHVQAAAPAFHGY